jgi:hypothetical protein
MPVSESYLVFNWGLMISGEKLESWDLPASNRLLLRAEIAKRE